MVDVYARTFMIATRLDAVEGVPGPRRNGVGAAAGARARAVAVMVMATCMHADYRPQLTGPLARIAAMLRRAQDRYEARRSAAALGRMSDEDLRDMGLTRADAARSCAIRSPGSGIARQAAEKASFPGLESGCKAAAIRLPLF